MGNADVARRIFDSWNRDDDEWENLVAGDIDFHNPRDAVDPDRRVGREGVRTMRENLARSFESHDYGVEDIAEDGDEVVATVLFTARGRTSGAELSNRIGYWWTIREGRAVRAEWFRDPAAAFAAAGVARD